ncbi:MAG: hypothetical protein R3F56_12300 [Planctomycetota bacterium]
MLLAIAFAIASPSGSVRARHALAERVDDLLRVGPAAAEQPRQHSCLALCHQLAVGEHGELSGIARDAARAHSETLFDDGGETRRAGSVASSRAVADLDVHGSSVGDARPLRKGS